MFVTGDRSGTVSLWKDRTVMHKIKLFTGWTLVTAKSGTIFAASQGTNILELNNDLEKTITHKVVGRHQQPVSMDANEEYLVVGYGGSSLYGPGNIEVRGRGDNFHVFQIEEVFSLL